MAVKQMKLGSVIQVGFTVILLLMVTNGVTMFWVMRKMSDSSSWVAHTYEVKLKLEKLKRGSAGLFIPARRIFLSPTKMRWFKFRKPKNPSLNWSMTIRQRFSG